MRAFALPLIAVGLVAAVLGIQVAAGGTDYVPRKPADPCVPRPVPPIQPQMDAVAERVVLLGLDNAACQLGITRERLVLALADPHSLDPRAPAALKAGMLAAVDRLDREGRLPRCRSSSPKRSTRPTCRGSSKTLIRAIPDGTVDGALPTGSLLRRAVGNLDVAKLVGQLNDPNQLQSAIKSAILKAARDQILARLHP